MTVLDYSGGSEAIAIPTPGHAFPITNVCSSRTDCSCGLLATQPIWGPTDPTIRYSNMILILYLTVRIG